VEDIRDICPAHSPSTGLLWWQKTAEQVAKHSERSIERKKMRRRRSTAVDAVHIESLILTIRTERVILDSDLAALYGVETRVLNQAVKRNIDKFPDDFMFRLTRDEAQQWRRSRSQSVILKRGSNIKYVPFAFTEHGAIMAANVLNSPRAVQMSVFVVRAFVRMRVALTRNKELAHKLAELERELKKRLDMHETAIVGILQRIMNLIDPPALPEPKRRPIGFGIEQG
jgi:phage regulator Rha-like protein